MYRELRKLAAEEMAQEKAGQTPQATALVHEAYLRLVDVEITHPWDRRRHFVAAAAEAMRRVLIENARRKGRQRFLLSLESDTGRRFANPSVGASPDRPR